MLTRVKARVKGTAVESKAASSYPAGDLLRAGKSLEPDAILKITLRVADVEKRLAKKEMTPLPR